MKLSVVIINYNVRYFLELCLQSVKEAIQAMDAEIIVVDNNSVDDSCEMLKNRFPEVILIENTDNVGFAKANNQGVAKAKGEYVCILNPDTVVGVDVFDTLISVADRLPNVGFLGPRLIDGTGNFLPESKRNIPSPLTSFRRLFKIRLGNVKSYYADHVLEEEIGDVDILVGAFLLVKKKNYLTIKGFDEDYFMYGEDIDISYKIKKKGLQNYYVGEITAIHYKGESTDRNAVYIRRFYGAMRIFYKKHFRSNWFLDKLVSIAIRLVSVIQSFRNYDKEKRIIDHYYLVSDNHNVWERLCDKVNQRIEKVSIESIVNLGDKNIEIIFDNNFISFTEIIRAIQNLKTSNCTFKIRPANCDYIIGSNFSDGKGEVLVF
ncbi:glycosyltransferase family 2 protein [Aquimarina algiphila]|uniref:glycosyltransferase family 2 protein n=1 Tax=Aquimarina algiphila TaxID=2047982 RepID=UPI00232DE539|nr:glycosyltransferase family 2 protein [Aquimarina algiphila]